jgi:hypothetical protein
LDLLIHPRVNPWYSVFDRIDNLVGKAEQVLNPAKNWGNIEHWNFLLIKFLNLTTQEIREIIKANYRS